MASKIQAAFPEARVELIEGVRGVFTVLAEGREIWNKHREGGFPPEREVIDRLGSRG